MASWLCAVESCVAVRLALHATVNSTVHSSPQPSGDVKSVLVQRACWSLTTLTTCRRICICPLCGILALCCCCSAVAAVEHGCAWLKSTCLSGLVWSGLVGVLTKRGHLAPYICMCRTGERMCGVCAQTEAMPPKWAAMCVQRGSCSGLAPWCKARQKLR